MTEVHNLRKLYYDEGKNITEIAKQTGRERESAEGIWRKQLNFELEERIRNRTEMIVLR